MRTCDHTTTLGTPWPFLLTYVLLYCSSTPSETAPLAAASPGWTSSKWRGWYLPCRPDRFNSVPLNGALGAAIDSAAVAVAVAVASASASATGGTCGADFAD